MANLVTLPALGVALFVAAGTGVYLGESSIGLIKPDYFQGPAVHPRERGAALDPNAIRPREAAFSDLYGWVEGDAALTRDCGNCDAIRARDAHVYSAVVPYFGSSANARPAVAQPSQAPEAPEPAQARPSPAAEAGARIARYANYRVSADEAPAYPDYKSRDVYVAGGEGEGGAVAEPSDE